MISRPENVTRKRIPLMGPLISQWTHESLIEIQNSLRNDSRFEYLAISLANLPDLMPIMSQIGIVDKVSTNLEALRNFALGEEIPKVEELTNSQMAPLTLLSQVLHWTRVRDACNPWLGSDDKDVLAVQGLCVGFLLAAVLSAAENQAEFEQLITNSLRLVACIGGVVDSDISDRAAQSHFTTVAIRCETASDKTYLDACLELFPEAYISCIKDVGDATVTISTESLDPFLSHIRKANMKVMDLGLNGRYHYQGHKDTAEKLKQLCAEFDILKLKVTNPLRLPLRSTASTQIITCGNLHEIAIDSILCRKAHWFETVKRTVSDMDVDYTALESFGLEPCIPRTLSSHKLRVHDKFTNSYSGASSDEIAIVGMSCRFPGSDSPESLWKLLESGETATSQLPPGRFGQHATSREPRLESFWGGFIQDPDQFDHRFFNISGREAKSMDPQQRLALQVTYEALESAGYCGQSPDKRESDIGCYLGVGTVDYENNVASENANAFSALGTLRAFVSGRVSHFFGWTGPSITFDTACSSSAVAIHTACKALLSGECSMAVSGGVNIMTSPILFENLFAASFLNPNGPSRAFDASTSGYCRGEGAGILVLKRLSKAVADRDDILGVISSSTVNQSPNTGSSITIPSSQAQSSLYKKALREAGVEANDITYVEAHGTGTPIGDPIEYESVRLTFSNSQRTQDLFLGSLKDNIGHAEAASGVAAIIKTVLMMRHGIIPKQANFTTLNPNIKSSVSDRICVPKSNQKWTSHQNLIALVNNYGAAGSNVSMVIREHAKQRSLAVDQGIDFLTPHPIILSAKSEASLQQYMDKLKFYLGTTNASLSDIANELSRRQNPSFQYRLGLVAYEKNTLLGMLENMTKINIQTASLTTGKLPVVLTFGGQTGQSVTVRKEVYYNCDRFRLNLDKCDLVCKTLGLPSIFPAIFEEAPVHDLVQLHCMLLSLQVSSARSWLDAGLRVDTLIGHSFGQISALCVSRSIDLEDAFRFVSGRARLIRDSWGSNTGGMLSVGCNREGSEALLRNLDAAGCHVEITCYNGPQSVVLAGPLLMIAKAEEYIHENCPTFKTTRLQNTHAYHSRLADPILDELRVLAQTITVRTPRLHVETCSPHSTWDDYCPEALVEHTRQPVHFSSAVERIGNRLPSAIWLEAGSGTPIITMSRRILSQKRNGDKFISLNLHGSGALESLASATCQLWSAGSEYYSWQTNALSSSSMLDLPLYQFERSTHWLDYKPCTALDRLISVPQSAVSLIDHDAKTMGYLFSVNTSHASYQLALKGHVVGVQELCPASLYLALAAKCASMISTDQQSQLEPPCVTNVVFSAPLASTILSGVFIHLQKVDSRTFDFTMYSYPALQSKDKLQKSSRTQHSNGRLTMPEKNDAIARAQWTLLQKLAGRSPGFWLNGAERAISVHGNDIYRLFSTVVGYASYYQGVQTISALDHEAVGTVTVSSKQQAFGSHGYYPFDPVAVDNFLQIAGIHVNCLAKSREGEVFICTSIEDIIFGPSIVDEKNHQTCSWKVCSRYEVLRNKSIKNDIFIYDQSSMQLAIVIIGANFRSIAFEALSNKVNRLASSKEHQTAISTGSSRDIYNTNYGSADSKIHLDSVTRANQTPVVEVIPKKQPSSSDDAKTVMHDLRELLSNIIEMPISEITPNTALIDIGIDSLLVTEVIDEIKTKFGVNLIQMQVLGCADVLELSKCIHTNQDSTPTRVQAESTLTNSSNGLREVETNSSADDAEGMLLDSDNLEKSVSAVSWECFPHACSVFDEHAQTTKFAGFYVNCVPIQSELAISYIVVAFAKLGCDLRTLEPGQRVPACPHHERHKKLIPQIYRILEEGGIISLNEDATFKRTAIPISHKSEHTLMAEMLENFPQHASETKLLHSTGSRLADCLIGDADPLSILFKNPVARDLLQDVYANAPMFGTGSKVLQDFITSIILQLGNSRREIKILEIGAGTGGTTRPLVDILSPLVEQGTKLSYTFTDVSPSFVASARHKFSQFPFMRYMVLDVEKVPEKSMEGAFDLVIATNCIHATRDLVNSTTNIRKMLQADGLLCLLELTRKLPWFDLVFGLLEGWWLFNDGRRHVLANEAQWETSLRKAGFEGVAWTNSPSQESDLLRLIVATPQKLQGLSKGQAMEKVAISNVQLEKRQTLIYKTVDGLDLLADIYYPPTLYSTARSMPIALMIHGGGHIMLSRHDVNPQHVKRLLEYGFLPISVDYRLCPEVTLSDGPMTDVVDALAWIRNVLPSIHLIRSDIRVDTTRVVAVGWSTGGHLAMSLGWTSIPRGIKPPKAVLGFYCPTDYEDEFWTKPNYPSGVDKSTSYDLDDIIAASGVKHAPVAQHKIERSHPKAGGWMFADEARSRLALYMNTRGRTLHVLARGLSANQSEAELTMPNSTEIAHLSPLAQIRDGKYNTPTFIIHPRQDDLIPWQQSQRTWEALHHQGIEAELRLLEHVPHLFDLYPESSQDNAVRKAVQDAFDFLKRHACL